MEMVKYSQLGQILQMSIKRGFIITVAMGRAYFGCYRQVIVHSHRIGRTVAIIQDGCF